MGPKIPSAFQLRTCLAYHVRVGKTTTAHSTHPGSKGMCFTKTRRRLSQTRDTTVVLGRRRSCGKTDNKGRRIMSLITLWVLGKPELLGHDGQQITVKAAKHPEPPSVSTEALLHRILTASCAELEKTQLNPRHQHPNQLF